MDRVSKVRESRRAPSATGMINHAGQYNCFLNVVVQSLWHLKSFQDSLVDFPEHTHASAKQSCVICALYNIFHEYREAKATKLDSINLRQALSDAFAEQQKFQEGVMADAGECYIELLQLIAQLLPTDELKNKLVHSLFDTVMAERTTCMTCNATSKQPKVTSNTSLLYVTRLLEASVALGEKLFDTLIGASMQQDTLACPKCSNQAYVSRRFRTLPAVYTLSLVWPTTRPRRALLNDFFNTISMQLDLRNICEIEVEDAKTKSSTYRFRGMILYYGRHYTAVFYHASLNQWLRFDDTKVDPIGKHWHEVTDWCVQSRFQPSMLFYEREIAGQQYYEAVPQDVIPRPLVEVPRVQVEDPILRVVCPRLEGVMYRKSKREWLFQWVKLHDWRLSFCSKPQQQFNPAAQRWFVCRNDTPVLEIPIDSIITVEQDQSPHNFNRKPHYMNIVVRSDAGPQTNGKGLPASSSSEPSIEYTLFVEGEAAYVRWLSAISTAKDLLRKAQEEQRDLEKLQPPPHNSNSSSHATHSAKKNGAHHNRDASPSRNGLQHSPPDGHDLNGLSEEPSALEFAPNASLEDLRRIEEMEKQSPRKEGDSIATSPEISALSGAVQSYAMSPNSAQQPAQQYPDSNQYAFSPPYQSTPSQPWNPQPEPNTAPVLAPYGSYAPPPMNDSPYGHVQIAPYGQVQPTQQAQPNDPQTSPRYPN